MGDANSLEEKWDLLDENEQKMVDSYMNNLLSTPNKMVLNLDDFPARKKRNTQASVIVNPDYREPEPLELVPESEQEPEPEPVAEEAAESTALVEVAAEEETKAQAPEVSASPVASHKEANPAALGLLGFGMTTCLLNLHNAGVIELSIMILAMGITMGGLAQIIAGIMEFKNGNTFGATAFTAYGLFWWSLVFILVNPASFFAEGASASSMGWYMVFWCIFTFFMYFGTLKSSVALRVVFASLAVLFFLLAVEKFSGLEIVGIIAGFEGIFCGAVAVYTAVATVINEEYKNRVMPV